MPSYIVTCRGGLQSKAGLKPTGSIVEMSEKDALSLPPGTVELAPVKVESKPEPKPNPKSDAKASKDSK
jgi:hypothetical protein